MITLAHETEARLRRILELADVPAERPLDLEPADFASPELHLQFVQDNDSDPMTLLHQIRHEARTALLEAGKEA